LAIRGSPKVKSRFQYLPGDDENTCIARVKPLVGGTLTVGTRSDSVLARKPAKCIRDDCVICEERDRCSAALVGNLGQHIERALNPNSPRSDRHKI
jgi:hypothetical protein